ncbi:hypothetical protein [Pseudothauera rhizosphaerae]|nr:hypothetical protein [Pseudothauera rhizosphaerae]
MACPAGHPASRVPPHPAEAAMRPIAETLIAILHRALLWLMPIDEE